ncbi:hypothetical protein SRHO_G00302170 [Serrasalmus rhombeus]
MGKEAEDILTSLHLSPAEASDFYEVKNRRISLPLMPRVKELNRMEQQGVISKVEQPTEWCAPMVVVPKETGKMDDVLIWGATQQQHDERLQATLSRLQEAGVTLNEKCEFFKSQIKFLGQIIEASGVRADPEKVNAVKAMREPENISETRPLRDLLKKSNMWAWGSQQQEASDRIKEELTTPPGLALYDTNAEMLVSADASSYGLGTVLLQKQPGTAWKPIAYASQALTTTEQRYAQIEKEALASTWACERFEEFLLEKTFHIETDHKPLVPLLGSKTLDALPPRIQRLRMRLLRFSYTISHVAGKNIATADILSRAPVSNTEDELQQEEIDLYVDTVMASLPATEPRLQEIRTHQDSDPTLCQLKKHCADGWPDRFSIKREIKPYLPFSGEFTVQNGVLLRGERIVIPVSLHVDILNKLHEGQLGLTKCRERAKQSVWWPGLSKELQRLIENCDTCACERTNLKN